MSAINKHIHFIGICGVAMSALAMAFSKQDWLVTGSDVGFYPPVSTNLEKNGIKFYPGWHPAKMLANGQPDLVVVGNVASSTNPEWKYAREHKLNYLSYPQTIAKYFVKTNSVVCAGTYGKTTTSALLAWILTQAGYEPSYMFGGLAIDENFVPAQMSDGDWSVLEGDEYKSARWDDSPKFTHYSPTHLLLTAIQWDHADVFPTADSYRQAFKKLATALPAKGLAVISEKIDQEIVKLFICPVVRYGANNIDYQYKNVKQTKDGLTLDVIRQNQTHHLTSTMLGEHMAENICASFALAHQIGLEPDKIIKAISAFPGLKRRLEKRGTISGANVYDDIAHSPAKASFTLKTLRQVYPHSKIYAVFEPNTGNRRPQSTAGYANAFRDADEVIIPRLTKIKIDPNDLDKSMDGQKLSGIISQTHPQASYTADDKELVNYLKIKIQPGDVVVWLGSHGFRGMIENLISLHQ